MTIANAQNIQASDKSVIECSIEGFTRTSMSTIINL